MTSNKTSRRLALLAAVLSLLMLLSFAVIPGFAEGTAEPTEVATGEAAVEPTEAATGDDATEPSEENTAETSAATSAATSTGTSASTSASTSAATNNSNTNNNDGWNKEDTYRLVINLSVGAVIVIAVVVLAFIFRKKIPGFVKALKSECGKIVWCPKDKLKKNTIVVLVIILALAALIAIMDFAFVTGYPLLKKLVTSLIP